MWQRTRTSGIEADQRQLLEALGPTGAGAPSRGESVEAESGDLADSPPLSNWMWINGEWVEVKTPTEGQEAEPSQREAQQPEFDWESLAEPLAASGGPEPLQYCDPRRGHDSRADRADR